MRSPWRATGPSASRASGPGRARTGSGARVCIVDSGVDATIRSSAGRSRRRAVGADEDGEPVIADDGVGDVAGHGTACAGIVRSLAPGCAITSVRVLGAGRRGSRPELLAGLAGRSTQGFDVVNLSLSTRKRAARAVLHELADRRLLPRHPAGRVRAQPAGRELPVALLLGVLGRRATRGRSVRVHYNPRPPVEFFARGVDVEVAVAGRRTHHASPATPSRRRPERAVRICPRQAPALTPFQVKGALHLLADNVQVA